LILEKNDMNTKVFNPTRVNFSRELVNQVGIKFAPILAKVVRDRVGDEDHTAKVVVSFRDPDHGESVMIVVGTVVTKAEYDAVAKAQAEARALKEAPIATVVESTEGTPNP
jgi:hypothetical protein